MKISLIARSWVSTHIDWCPSVIPKSLHDTRLTGNHHNLVMVSRRKSRSGQDKWFDSEGSMYSWAYCYCSVIGYYVADGSKDLYEMFITGGGELIISKTYETLEEALEAYEYLTSGNISVDSLKTVGFDNNEIIGVA